MMTTCGPRPRTRSEHIMVVESESATRNVLSGFLAGRGYRALRSGPTKPYRASSTIVQARLVVNVAGSHCGGRAGDVPRNRSARSGGGDRRPAVLPILEQARRRDVDCRPFDGRELEAALAAALKHRPVLPSSAALPTTLEALLLGTSAKMAAVGAGRSASPTPTSPSWCVARPGRQGSCGARPALYSMLRDKPFVKVNARPLPADLLESELFGFERGAFTGAVHAKPGRFEAADEGTIFLDEIGEMSATLQAKMLQSCRTVNSRARWQVRRARRRRVISAPTATRARGRRRFVSRGPYFRINVVEISSRRSGSEGRHPLLVEHFLRPAGRRPAPAGVRAVGGTMELFGIYAWPATCLELENLVKRIVVLGDETAAHEVIERRQMTARSACSPSRARRPWRRPTARSGDLAEGHRPHRGPRTPSASPSSTCSSGRAGTARKRPRSWASATRRCSTRSRTTVSTRRPDYGRAVAVSWRSADRSGRAAPMPGRSSPASSHRNRRR